MKMPWGEYKGVDIVFINSNYLKWIIDQDWFLAKSQNELLCCDIEKELNERDFSHGHFYDDKVRVPGETT